MAYTLTQEQADEVVRVLGFDSEVDDYELVEGVHTYFLEVPYVLKVYADAQVELLEESETDPAQDTQRVQGIMGPDVGVVELKRDGRTMGLLDWFDVDAATPEQRHIHDLRVLDITERTM